MNKQEANKQLEVLVVEAMLALRKAEDFADEHKLSFHFSPEYGMGGYYEGDTLDGDEPGWYPSSQSC